MKRVISVFIACILIALLTGCADNAGEDPSADVTLADTDNQHVTELVTEAPTEAQPVIENSYPIHEIITNFSEDRAWVTYMDNDYTRYVALIDTDGYVKYSIKESEIGDGTGRIAASEFEDGLSCLYVNGGSPNFRAFPGMIVADRDGKIVFDGSETGQTVEYYYLAYGDKTFLILKHEADFSTNNAYICEMNTEGIIEKETLLPEVFIVDKENWNSDYFVDSFSYYGEGIFLGDYDGQGRVIYNMNTQELYSTYHLTSSSTRSYQNGINLYFYDKFIDGRIIGGWSVDYDHSVNNICSITVSDLSNHESWTQYCESPKVVWAPGVDVSCISEGFINNTYDNDYVKGVYDYDANILGKYPEEWNIAYGDGFSGGLAALELIGADNKNYVTIVNKTGQQQYQPIQVDNCSFPAWHGYIQAEIDNESVIISPSGNKTTLNELNQLSTDYSIGNETVRNGLKTVKTESTGRYDHFVGTAESDISTVAIISSN